MPALADCADGPNSCAGSSEERGPIDLPKQAGSIDLPTQAGMSFLYAGIAVSMAMLFFPTATQELIGWLLSPLVTLLVAGPGASAQVMVPAAKLAQSLWLTGAICLCIQPLRTKNWPFLVTGSCIVLASILPLLGISSVTAVLVRSASTLVGIAWLGSLEGLGVCRALLPWYWGRVWRGEMGSTALAILGSEILTWGYSLFAVNAILGWAFLAAGSGVMMKFTRAGKRDGLKIAFAWYRLNYVYVITGIIQLVWALLALHAG